MLQPLMHVLNTKKIILASSSPRRADLLKLIGLKFEIVPSAYEENVDKTKFPDPWEYVTETALQKTIEVTNRIRSKPETAPDLVIGADTMVTQDGKILGKPTDRDDAVRMLSMFSGSTHVVYTGVVLMHFEASEVSTIKFHEATEVHMTELAPEVIQAYVDTGEPMDKAGAYGIQGLGSTLVQGITGDYFNVMGMPLHKLSEHLSRLYGGKK